MPIDRLEKESEKVIHPVLNRDNENEQQVEDYLKNHLTPQEYLNIINDKYENLHWNATPVDLKFHKHNIPEINDQLDLSDENISDRSLHVLKFSDKKLLDALRGDNLEASDNAELAYDPEHNKSPEFADYFANKGDSYKFWDSLNNIPEQDLPKYKDAIIRKILNKKSVPGAELKRALTIFPEDSIRSLAHINNDVLKSAPDHIRNEVLDKKLGITGGSHEDEDLAQSPEDNYQNWNHGEDYVERSTYYVEDFPLTDAQADHIARHGTPEQQYAMFHNNPNINPEIKTRMYRKWLNDDYDHGYSQDDYKGRYYEDAQEDMYDDYELRDAARDRAEENYSYYEFLRNADWKTWDEIIDNGGSEEDARNAVVEKYFDGDEERAEDSYNESLSDFEHEYMMEMARDKYEDGALDNHEFLPEDMVNHESFQSYKDEMRARKEAAEREAAAAQEREEQPFHDSRVPNRDNQHDYGQGQHHHEMLKEEADSRGGAVDVGHMIKNYPNLKDEWKQIFGGKGKLTTEEIQQKIDSIPKIPYAISYGKWGENKMQNINSQDQTIMRLDHSPESLNKLKEHGIYDTFKKISELSQRSGHPTNANSIAWARVDTSNPKHWMVDEVQSDFASTARDFLKQNDKHSDAEALDKIINLHGNWREALLNKVIKTAKANGVEKISTHSPESKAAHTGAGRVHSVYKDSYQKVPRKMGFMPSEAETLPLSQKGKEIFGSAMSKESASDKINKHFAALKMHLNNAKVFQDLKVNKGKELGFTNRIALDLQAKQHLDMAKKHKKEAMQLDPTHKIKYHKMEPAVVQDGLFDEHIGQNANDFGLFTTTDHDRLLEKQKTKSHQGHTLDLTPKPKIEKSHSPFLQTLNKARSILRKDAPQAKYTKLLPANQRPEQKHVRSDTMTHQDYRLEKGQRGDWQKEGYTLRIGKDPDSLEITAHAPDGTQVGEVFVDHANDGKHIFSSNTRVHDAHGRKGLATAMYQLAEKHTGKKMKRSDLVPEARDGVVGSVSPSGNKLWEQPARPFGKSQTGRSVAGMKAAERETERINENKKTQRNIMSKFPNLLPEDSLEKDQIPGGLADKKKPSDFDSKQIKMGQKVEMEHTNNPAIAREISQDHLSENPKYYTDLKTIEPEHFKKAAGEKMQKGSAQKRLKFNPEEVSPASRQETEGWTSNYPGYDRPQTPLKGNALARALHKLHATTKTRRNPETGEREFLLYRGKTGRDSVGGLSQLSSFTPHKRNAIDFNRDFVNSLDSDYAKTEIFGDTNHPHSVGSDISNPERDKYIQDNLAHVYQAWVPESAIHHIPKQIGDTNLFSNLTAPKLTPKKATFANEHEVIVDTSKIKNITAMPRHQIEAEHFKELKLKHGGLQTRLEMKKLDKAVQSPGSQKDQFPKTYEALKLDGDIHNPAVMQHHMKLHEKHAVSATSPESAKHHWDNVKKIQAHLSGKLEKGARGDWKKEGYKLEYDHNHDHTNSVVRAVNSVGNEVGRYEFEKHEPSDRNIYIVDSLTHPDHRRKGIATSAYKMAQKNMRGIVYPLEDQQSSEAQKLWSQPNRPFGKSFPEVLKKANAILQKARKASPIGTITERHDGKYIKTQDGWEPYNQENATQAQNYINARQSSFSNVGEDIKGAARHKRTAYTPGDRVTQENNKELINHYSNTLAEEIGPHNPLNPFVLKQVLARFPKMKPGVDENVYNNYLSHVTDFIEKNKANPEIFTTLLNGLKRSLVDKINHDRKQPGYVRGSDSFIIKYVNNTISPYGIATGRVTKDLADFTTAAKTASANHTGTTTPTNDQLMGFFHTQEGAKFLKDAMGGKIQKPASEDGGRQRKLKYAPVDRYVKVAERKGPPVGLDTPQQQVDFLTKAGKIRGLQWGNSVTDPEREHHLKYTAEALKDLMDVTGMPLEMISFNGRLGLAFGARGRGRALAHYEPAEMTINLTRQNGVGSLAHEWGHFLDNVLAKTHNTSTSDEYMYLSEGSQYKMRREESPLTQAMTSLISSDGWKDFYESSRRHLLDLRKQGYSVDSKYWLTPKEMFARAFECHIDHKLSAMGRANTYLTGVTRGGFWPTEEISAKMAPLFDKFFEEFKKSDHLKKSIDILNKSALQKAIPAGMIFVRFDGDSAGSKVIQAEKTDDLKLAADISNRINAGGEAAKQKTLELGGQIILGGGDDLGILLPTSQISAIDQIREAFRAASGFSMTAGYGTSIPQAIDALLWGKLRGKNQTVKWAPYISEYIGSLEHKQTQEDKIRNTLQKTIDVNYTNKKKHKFAGELDAT